LKIKLQNKEGIGFCFLIKRKTHFKTSLQIFLSCSLFTKNLIYLTKKLKLLTFAVLCSSYYAVVSYNTIKSLFIVLF